MGTIDAVIVGSGPNGLAAAIAIAQTGRRVVVFEAAKSPGGGARSGLLTLPGFTHDICSAIHPFAVASPFFRGLPLSQHGLQWIEPAAMLAHPFDKADAGVIHRSADRTAEGLGLDASAYRRIVGGVVDEWPRLEDAVLGPLRWPRHPLSVARFGLQALGSAKSLSRAFRTGRTRGLLAGIAAHGMLPLDRRPSAAFGLVLAATAHVAGWVLARGGTGRITDALVAHLQSLGGEVVTGTRIDTIDALPPARAILCDLSPRPFLRLAGHRLPSKYRRALMRYRYGPGVFKVDWALDGPIPWRDPECAQAATVHLGGSWAEISQSEDDTWAGRTSERPFVILAQPTLFDPTRAPEGRHIAWAYCHVPAGSVDDMAPRIEQQIERFAPGFRDRVLARVVMRPSDVERHNANFVGGDIASGVTDLRQVFARPTWRTYTTPVKGLYLCSASTPPGPGVHGMCGYFAARRALQDVLRD